MEQKRTHFDITGYSFEEFVTFVFQRDVKIVPPPEDSWYLHIECEFDPLKIGEYYLRLFREPEFLRDAYTVPQLEEGFWAIQSCAVEWSVTRLLGNDVLPFSTKEACVRSMFDLFERLFVFEPLDSAVDMWWDSLRPTWVGEGAEDFHSRFMHSLTESGDKSEEWSGIVSQVSEIHERDKKEELLLQDVKFGTLSRILSLPYEHCHHAALHGLGH